MRGILAIVLALTAFGCGAVQAQQPVPKEELKMFIKAIEEAFDFSTRQTGDVSSCLEKNTEVEKVICVKQTMDNRRAGYEAIKKYEGLKPSSKSDVLQGAADILDAVVFNVNDDRGGIEACSKAATAQGQLLCLNETFTGTASVYSFRFVLPIISILKSLAR